MAEVRYHLPETRVTLSGIVEHVTTTFGATPDVDSHPLSTGVIWETYADQQAAATLNVDAGMLEDRIAALTFTADRRLASLASSSTGKLDGFVKAVAKAAATVVVLAGGKALNDGGEAAKFTTAADGYDHLEPEASKRLAKLRAQLATARTTLAEKRQALLDRDPAEQIDEAHLKEVRALTALVGQIEDDVDQANAAFQAWKQARTAKRTEQLEAVLELRQLPFWRGDVLDWEATSPPISGELGARDIWDRLGFVVARLSPSRTPRLAEQTTGGVLVRIPRQISVAVIRRDDGGGGGAQGPHGSAHLEEIIHRTVMDDRCDTEFLPLERRLAGSREVAIGFDDSGALVSLSKTSRSGAAEVVGSLSGGITDGLGAAKSTLDTLDGLRTHEQAARKTRLDLELATAKAELELAGIAATKAERARVAELVRAAGADLGI